MQTKKKVNQHTGNLTKNLEGPQVFALLVLSDNQMYAKNTNTSPRKYHSIAS